MAKLTMDEINAVKGKGFLRNRGTELFSGRVVPVGTVFTAEQLHSLAELSEKFGNGKLMATSRQSIEVPGIAYENIPAAIEFAEAHDLHFAARARRFAPLPPARARPASSVCMTHRRWPRRSMRLIMSVGAK